MGLRINTNTSALNTQFQLRNNQRDVAKAMERLSSGQKISKSADDIVGLSKSEAMKAQLRSLKQVERNSQDAVSLTQVADSSLGQVANILIRLRELGIQCASDTVADRERALIGREFNQMLNEIDRIANSTEYNGTKLLSGVGSRLDFQINTGNSESVDRISFDPSLSDVGVTALGLGEASVVDKESAQNTLSIVDRAINNVSELRATFGSIQSRLNETTENIMSNYENISATNSRIRDTDVAEESTEMAKKNMMLQAGTAILAQANQQPGQSLSLLNKG